MHYFKSSKTYSDDSNCFSSLESGAEHIKKSDLEVIIPEKPKLLFREFLKKGMEEHIRQKKVKGSPLAHSTLRNYDHYYRKFTELAGIELLAVDFNQTIVDRITEILIDSKEYCNTSIRSMYAPIKSILRKSYELGLLAENVKMPKIPTIKDSEYKLKTRISMSQFEQLKQLKFEKNIQEEARDSILLAFFGCGMRMSEVIGLRMSFLNPTMRIFQYYSSKKKKMSPTYEMSEKFWEIAQKYYDSNLPPNTFLLPIMRKHSGLNYGEMNGKLDSSISKVRDRFNYWYKGMCKELNFPEYFTPHSARKTLALNLYETTGDIFKVKELLNHTKIETTIIYLARNGVRTIRTLGETDDIFDKFYEQEKLKNLNQTQVHISKEAKF